MINRLILFFLFSAAVLSASGQGKKIPPSFCFSEIEYQLYQMVNEYRGRFDLPPIPLSRSLSYVASLHVKDLVRNNPDQGGCNSHSWSDKGFWKPFCYPKDETKQNSVWDKPKELTPYPAKGYEIIYWDSEVLDIDSVMAMWRSVDYFNNFLTNTGKWTGKKWNAIGIAIYGSYVSAWFGEAADPAGTVRVCGMEEAPADTVKKPDTTVKSKVVAKKEPVVKKEPVKIKSDPSDTSAVKPQPVKPGIYYIVIKSQQPMAVMEKLKAAAVSNGFTGATIINGDKLRLSVAEFRQKAAADSALRVVKKTYKDAWILVR